jgi:hypothetical protein
MLISPPQKVHTVVQPFSPSLGAMEYRWLELVSKLQGNTEQLATIRHQLVQLVPDENKIDRLSVNSIRLSLALSLLADMVSTGANIVIADSRIYIAWPEWDSATGRNSLRTHLSMLRDSNGDVSEEMVGRVLSALPTDVSPSTLVTALEHGKFRLRAGDETHPSGVSYSNIFAVAVRYWSMPYKDREGRRTRFVLTLSHPSLGDEVPAGILEVAGAAAFVTL